MSINGRAQQRPKLPTDINDPQVSKKHIQNAPKTGNSLNEKTIFQTRGNWKPSTDVRSDVAVVYGADDRPGLTFEQRVQSFRDHGYVTHFMTGIAWGNYQDYFLGKWDGKQHFDEGQVQQNGDTIWHGKNMPYIVPTKNFLKYFKEQIIKKVVDAGIDAIYLEEPEYWAKAGYSAAFKQEWKDYYGSEWQPQHVSPENTYLSNKLKYHLYYKALEEAFTYAKETTNVMRILLPAEPKKLIFTDAQGQIISDVKQTWDLVTKTSFLSFENHPDGIKVIIEW